MHAADLLDYKKTDVPFAKVKRQKLVGLRYFWIWLGIDAGRFFLFHVERRILKRFGIKKVMLFSMIAWVLRFGLFAYGNPADGLWMIILSCIVYGMAFDFFNISGSLFIETTTDSKIRSSAQGLFMMMTNGVGAYIGAKISGSVIDKYFTLKFSDMNSLLAFVKADADNPAVKKILEYNEVLADGTFKSAVYIKEWQPIWLTFSIYALVVAVLFALLFRHKHEPGSLENVSH